MIQIEAPSVKGKDLTLADILKPISEEMQVVETTLRDTAKVEYGPLAEVVEHIVSSGGKRIRPAVVLFATKLYPVDFDKALALAAAVETLHTATLIHDDVVDDSILRRGRPTINAFWDSGATVLAGDYVFAQAASFGAATGDVRVMKLFAQTLQTIVDGELRQLFLRRGGLPPREEYYHRIYSKTGSLFTLSTEAAGVLMGASPAETEALHTYGHNFGMAFQIVDDVLDFIGDERRVGKPVGSDLRQGTVTLPVYYFAEAHAEHPALVNYWNGDHHDSAVEELVGAIRESAAIEAALAEATEFVEKAVEPLVVLPDVPARKSLRDLAAYIVARRK